MMIRQLHVQNNTDQQVIHFPKTANVGQTIVSLEGTFLVAALMLLTDWPMALAFFCYRENLNRSILSEKLYQVSETKRTE